MGNMPQGLAITIIGVLIVFVVLVILWGFIAMMRVVFARNKQKTEASAPEAVSAAPAPAPVSAIAEEEDMDEIAAVITAAIASSLNTSTYRLKIRSIRRADNNVPAWNAASRRANIENKY